MECSDIRNRLFLKIDDELSDAENEELSSHLAQCESCNREYRLLNLPHRITQAMPSFTPSPFFYPQLRTRIEEEAQKIIGRKSFWGLARQTIPTLAGITLVLFSVFAFLEMRGPEADLHQAYESVFANDYQSQQMLTSAQVDISSESVLTAIAEKQFNHSWRPKLK